MNPRDLFWLWLWTYLASLSAFVARAMWQLGVEGLVTATGNANVKFIDVSTWSGLTYMDNDGTHPVSGPNGYGKLADLAQPEYEAAIA